MGLSLSVARALDRRIEGSAPANARIIVRNLSLAPYAPDSETLKLETRADAQGRFVLEGPVLRSGDLLRLQSGSGPKLSVLDVRLPADRARRPEAEIQGLRLYCSTENARFDNVLSRERIADPGIRVRFTNSRTKKSTDVTLDDEGKLPKSTRIAAQPGDIVEIRVAPDGGDFPKDKWGAVVAQAPNAVPTNPPLAVGSTANGTFRASALYIGGIEASDPAQGDVGDCWILATLSAIAHTQHMKIEALLKARPDGQVAVSLHKWSRATRAFVVEEVVVATDLFASDGTPVYASSTDAGEGWVSLIEKAYAQWKGGYEATAVGYPYAAFEALLGVRGEQIFTEL
jgi:Calpain family cysteine protease